MEMSTKDTKAAELGQPLACVAFISNNPSTPDQHTVHLLVNRFCWVLSSILSPSHDKQVCTVWFSTCQSLILVTANKKKKKQKTYQQQRPSYNWKTDNFPNQMWLWPKSGGEETVIHPGMLINYHTDCLLIFLCSLWYLMKYTHFTQTSHKMRRRWRIKSRCKHKDRSGLPFCTEAGPGKNPSIHSTESQHQETHL